MNSKLITAATRSLPASVREADGAAIVSLSADLIESGDSSVAKEARGIASYGLRKRLLLNLDWARSLPWREAMWLIALPVACVQTAMLIISTTGTIPGAISDMAPGKWGALAIFLSALIVFGAFTRKRLPLATGAVCLLTLLLIDEYGPGGGMRAGISHTENFSFEWMLSESILGPVALILIPSTFLLAVTGFVRPPVERPSLGVNAAWCAVTALAMVMLPGAPGKAASIFGVILFAGGVIGLTLSAELRRIPSHALAAGLLLASQTLLLGTQLYMLTLDPFNYNLNLGMTGHWLFFFATFFAVLAVPLLVGVLIVRLIAGPRRLP